MPALGAGDSCRPSAPPPLLSLLASGSPRLLSTAHWKALQKAAT